MSKQRYTYTVLVPSGEHYVYLQCGFQLTSRCSEQKQFTEVSLITNKQLTRGSFEANYVLPIAQELSFIYIIPKQFFRHVNPLLDKSLKDPEELKQAIQRHLSKKSLLHVSPPAL